jgi:hypothetical protein
VTYDENFSHGEGIFAPCCDKPTGKLFERVRLYVTSTNYSGTATDVGNCPECGKGYSVSFKVDKVVRVKDWDSKPLKELEAENKAFVQEQKRKQLEELKRELGQ